MPARSLFSRQAFFGEMRNFKIARGMLYFGKMDKSGQDNL